MSFSNVTVKEIYNCNDATVNFAIPSAYTDVGTIAVYLRDNSVDPATQTLLTLTTHYTLDDPTTPTLITTVSTYDEDRQIVVTRISPKTQLTDYVDIQNFETLEDQLDRMVMAIQELGEEVDRCSKVSISSPVSSLEFPQATTEKYIGWNTAADALENKDAPAAGATGATGAAGPTGAQGVKGDDGDRGDAGSNGAAGSDGVFSEIASKNEAEVGTNNTKGMSPLRVKEAIDSQVVPANITTNTNNIAANVLLIAQNTTRIGALENAEGLNRYAGYQVLVNNAAATAIVGSGASQVLAFSTAGTEDVNLIIKAYRKDDSEERISQIKLICQWDEANSIWRVAVEDETVLNDGNMSGLTFTITTSVSGDYYLGTLKVTTDNMTGGNDEGFIRYIGEEISI